MLAQLLLGSLLICMTLIVEVAFIGMASTLLSRGGHHLTDGNHTIRFVISLLAVVLWMLAAISISVWIWAAAFIVLDQFQTLEEALYFSAVSMTTLGYGDLVLEEEWRLLSGLIAANGLILFSLATAFFIEFMTQLRRSHRGQA